MSKYYNVLNSAPQIGIPRRTRTGKYAKLYDKAIRYGTWNRGWDIKKVQDVVSLLRWADYMHDNAPQLAMRKPETKWERETKEGTFTGLFTVKEIRNYVKKKIKKQLGIKLY